MDIKPVAIQQGTMTLVPKLDKLTLDNTNEKPSMELTWHKVIAETGDTITQQPLVLRSDLMSLKFPNGFTRYNPITGEEIPDAPKISQEEMMLFVYSVFKNLIITDISTDKDLDVPDDELIVEDDQ